MRFAVYILLVFVLCLKGQDSTINKRIMPELHGYVKYMEQFSFIDNPDTNYMTSLLHNRLNLRWTPQHWLFRLEARNRVFYGDQLKLNPGFMKSIGEDQGALDLSRVWADEYAVGLHSIVDRAMVNYNNEYWDITVGRQRINWGLNMVWNPNDIFNTYNFFDFDYEERPGSDAVRMQYQWNGFSAIEGALKKGKKDDDYTGAIMYRSNKLGYDYQTLAGVYRKDVLIGAGWAGSVLNAGFKGEFTYFHPYENLADTTGILNGSMSLDYSFKNGFYLHLSAYYNSGGSDKMNLLSSQQFFIVNPKQLLPFKFAGFFQMSKQINPLFTIGISSIYSPTNNTCVLVPSAQYSIASNWEVMLIGQCFFTDVNKVYRSLGNSIFLRLKWAF